MITKYLINLRQFNNGESDTITFPTFDQCMMYGIHKLKESIRNKSNLIQAILIEDSHGRKIVISPSQEELDTVSGKQYKHNTHDIKIQLYHDDEGDCNWIRL